MGFELKLICLFFVTLYVYAAIWAGAVLFKWITLLFEDELEFLRRQKK